MFNSKRILFIGSHPDDIEFGCGASISKIQRDYKDVEMKFLVLSNMKAHYRDKLMDECKESLEILGARDIEISSFKERKFNEQRQEICDYLFNLNKDYKPDIVFTHPIADLHQDHEIISKESLRVFKFSSIIGYEVPPSFYYNLTSNFYIKVNEMDVIRKQKSLSMYKTHKKKHYFNKRFIEAQLLKNGCSINTLYAEAFNILRLIC